jgi:hypothetical protein
MGTERAHRVGCSDFQVATEPGRLSHRHVVSAAVCSTAQPRRRERMSDDAKFILGIG